MALETDFDQADKAAMARLSTTPRAISVTVAVDGRLQIELSGGLALLVDARAVQGLERATADDLAHAQISPSGFGLHFPTLDADIYVPGLLDGRLGSERHMAAILGAKGGRAVSAAKSAAARRNGQRGGRPARQPPA